MLVEKKNGKLKKNQKKMKNNSMMNEKKKIYMQNIKSKKIKNISP